MYFLLFFGIQIFGERFEVVQLYGFIITVSTPSGVTATRGCLFALKKKPKQNLGLFIYIFYRQLSSIYIKLTVGWLCLIKTSINEDR